MGRRSSSSTFYVWARSGVMVMSAQSMKAGGMSTANAERSRISLSVTWSNISTAKELSLPLGQHWPLEQSSTQYPATMSTENVQPFSSTRMHNGDFIQKRPPMISV